MKKILNKILAASLVAFILMASMFNLAVVAANFNILEANDIGYDIYNGKSKMNFYWVKSADSSYSSFCAKGGATLQLEHTYPKYVDFYNLGENQINSYFRVADGLKTKRESYNATVWLVDNLIPDVGSTKETTIEACKNNLKQVLSANNASPKAIEAVDSIKDQQRFHVIAACAIWRFTKNADNENGKFKDNARIPDSKTNPDNDLANELLKELVRIAKLNKDYKHNATEVKITTNDDFRIAENNESTHKAGPFTANTELDKSKIKVSVNGTEITTTTDDILLEGNYNYYIIIPNESLNLQAGQNNSVKIVYNQINTKAYYLWDPNLSGQQNVITLKKWITAVEESGNEEAKAKNLDVALVKTIVSYQNPNEDPKEITSRFNPEDDHIDTSTIDEQGEHDAIYSVRKKTLVVKRGAIVKYKIYVFNEGEVDADVKVVDYLPEGLSLKPGTTDWTQEDNKITYNGDLKHTTAYNKDGNLSSAVFEVECVVEDTVKSGEILTNYSEVVVEHADDDNLTDIDSTPNNVEVDSYNEPASSSKRLVKFGNREDQNSYSQEDDDDFERVQVVDYTCDLALRKFISKINDTETEGREPQPYAKVKEDNMDVAYYSLGTIQEFLMEVASGDTTTYNYEHSKEPLGVEVGDYVTYTIRVYNEILGDEYNGYASKIVDRLPQYLVYDAEKTAKANEGIKWLDNIEVDTNDSTGRTLNINAKKEYIYALETMLYYCTAINEAHKDLQPYQEVNIVCKVVVPDNATDAYSTDEDKNYFVNIAHISEYGIYKLFERGEDGLRDFSIITPENEEERIDNGQVIDRDSTVSNSDDTDSLDNIYNHALEIVESYDEQDEYIPGLQDDDDFEAVYIREKKEIPGEYTIKIKKVSAEDENETIEGAKFAIKSTKANSQEVESSATDKTGITTLLNKVVINEEGKDTYTVRETVVPDQYKLYDGEIKLEVAKKLVDKKYVLDVENTKVTGKNVKLDVKDSVITITVPNPEKEFDLALRKFITAINGDKLEGDASREPEVDLSTLINGNSEKNGEKTATYTHTKEPVLVNPTDIVEYTLRIYNEGELDGFASRIIDDVPKGVTMVAPEYDEDGKAKNLNAEYRWVMYKEMTDEEKASEELANKSVIKYADKYYVETEKAEEAVIISTDYLSKENSEDNLISAFDGKTLSSKDIKVEFKVKPSTDKDAIITNYAQISEHQYKDGTPIDDRDSTPNVWKDNEDDQDVEHLRVNWFDLALYKWVSSTIVTEDGKTKEYASGHTQNDKDKIVNVTVAKDKLNKTVVKFKWTIKVENQSPIPGYATELKDHIPEGLKFIEEDNKEFGWKLQKDGTVTTDYLKNTLLHEKETAEVTLVLTWVNGSDNLGVKVNYAEISEDFNAYGTPDIDSTPDNFTGKPVEDDEDGDEVRLNIRTGNGTMIQYVAITAGVLAMVAVGVVLIKKNVLDKEF